MRWLWPRRTDEERTAKAEQVSRSATMPDDAIRCPLCGRTFHPGEAAQCGGCPLAARCGLVMCPNCSYEFAP